jgi:primase-polymerase (primpol)-like protein
MTPRPNALSVQAENIPVALKAKRRWTCWRFELDQKANGSGRWVKVPCTVAGHHAKANDPATWTSFGEALAAYRRGSFDGLGFCLGDGWGCVDFDRCRVDARDLDTARPLLERIAATGCYVEVSPSGTGYKAYGRSPQLGGEFRFHVDPAAKVPWRTSRFCAVTGAGTGDPTVDITSLIDAWFPAPISVFTPTARPSFIKEGDRRGTEQIERRTDDEVVTIILNSPDSADKFVRLVQGDTSDYANDRSRAEQALLSMLALRSGDLEQVERLFKESKLYDHGRWEGRPSYRRASLNAILRFFGGPAL